MKPPLGAVVLVLALAGCGGDESSAGERACKIYQGSVAGTPQAIAQPGTLDTIKTLLGDMDAETRRAFADLITTAQESSFLSSRGGTVDQAAATVRTACLSEHSIDIASP